MVFNTGAALLDAIVLAVVSKEEEGTYGYKSHRMYEKPLMYQSPLCIRCSGDCRKTDALRYMTESAEAGTGVIIRSRNRAG
mgnify:CR=1 FL=1